jgi:ribose transport system permease protein
VSTTDAPQSTQYTLPAIAAVALGGTSLAGGRGGLTGPMYGAFAIYLLQNLLATLQIDPAYLQIVYGGTLVLAVVIGGRLTVTGRSRSHRTPGRFSGDRTAVVDRAQESRILSLDTEPRATSAAQRHVTIWRRLAEIQARFPIVQILAVAAVFVYGVITLPGLGDWSSVKVILLLASLTALASTGQTLLILMGGFDLGVAGFIVAGAVTVTALQGSYHLPFLVAMAAAAVGAGVLGAIAGNVCHRYRIQPLIVTLAMGTIAVGIVQVQDGGTATGSAQTWLATLTEPVTNTFGIGLPPIVSILIVVAILFWVFLHRTATGRRLLATGANERAAEYALVHTRKVWTLTFAFSAAGSALVGVLIAGYAGGVTETIGDPYLFGSVVGVIVGGTIFGGPGNYTRTCVGALFVTVLTEVLIGHGASAATTQIVQGAIILLAITAYGRQRRLRDRL